MVDAATVSASADNSRPISVCRLDSVDVALGGQSVLRDVSVQFAGERVTSIVGASGCGKTTLLRVLAGLQAASGGRVQTDDNVGFVFQKPALLPWLTARQNVLLPLEMIWRHRRGAVPTETADEWLRMVGLENALEKFPRQLSGGMQMRVSLARAMVTRPSLLLLDEPLSALDEMLREKLGELILRLWTRQRFTAVMVTHNVAEAIWMSHRVLVMDRGRVIGDRAIDLPWPRSPAMQRDDRFDNHFRHVAAVLRGAASA